MTNFRVLMKIADAKFIKNYRSEVHDLNQKTRCKMICNLLTVQLNSISFLLSFNTDESPPSLADKNLHTAVAVQREYSL